MSDVTSDVKGLNQIIRGLAGIPAQVEKANQHFLTRASLLVQRDAKANAPRSPTQAQINRNRKTKRDTSKQKKARATSRAKPGGLERSIERAVRKDHAVIYVAANSEAGSYAVKIHDEKGKTWSKRGIGTVAKGSKADDKFIERAIEDNAENLSKILNDELKGLKL